MKKLLLPFAMAVCFTGWGQDTLMKPMTVKKPAFKKEHMKVYRIFPNGIGNNVLAKAHYGRAGLGVGVTLYTEEHIHIIGLYEIIQYDVTDPSLAANVERTKIANYGAEVLYKIPIINNFCFNPKLSLAYITVTQSGYGNRYGQQTGFGFSSGFDVDYRLTGNFRIFAGAGYAISFPETHTAREYKSFFGTLQQLNIQVGIKF